MSKNNYRISRQAIEDLDKIWNYTFELWSKQQADKYYNGLISNCQEVAENPDKLN